MSVEDVARELQDLTMKHAQLREQLEDNLGRVREIEARFLSRRPEEATDLTMQKELRRKMVLARPWREELNVAYKAILATTLELDGVVHRIRQCQDSIAQQIPRR
jgi:predicted nuclease with TOPRIM domain